MKSLNTYINENESSALKEFISKCQSKDVYAVRCHDKRTQNDHYSYYDTEAEAKKDLTESAATYCMYVGKMKVYKVRYRKEKDIWMQEWEIKNTLSSNWCSDWIEPADDSKK